MGYLTYHTLTVRGISEEEVVRITDKLKEIQVVGYALNDCAWYRDGEACFGGEDYVTWYDHNVDMIAISRLFPDATFRLSGEGEGAGDLWNMYYKNGEMEHCPADIVYPEPQKIKWEDT